MLYEVITVTRVKILRFFERVFASRSVLFREVLRAPQEQLAQLSQLATRNNFV